MNLENRLKTYWDKVDRRGPTECWPWKACKNRKGYGQSCLNGKQTGAHRIAWILAYGPIPSGQCVLHHCDNPSCQNPNHLFLGTNLENIADKVSKGRHRGARGEKSSTAKLTKLEVQFIRHDYSRGIVSAKLLAKRYGVHVNHIYSICSGRTWRHV